MLNPFVIPVLLTCLLFTATVSAQNDITNPEAAYQTARDLAHNGDYQQAIAIYTRLLRDHPENADYLLGAGQAYLWQGRPAAAVPLLEKGMAIAPDYEDIYHALSQAYENSRQPQKARAVYRKAVTRFSGPGWAVQGLKKHEKKDRPELSLQLSYRLAALSNNNHDWRDRKVTAGVKYSSGRQVNVSYVNSERFGLIDDTLALETYQPVNKNNTLYGELRYSNSHKVLPQYSAYLQWTHEFTGGWGIIGGYKRIEYTESGVHQIDLGLEYYFSNYRAAYTAYISNSDSAGLALSHRFQLGYTFDSMSNIQLAVATGSEVEKPVNARSIIKTDFTTVTIWGELLMNRRWSLIYAVGYTDLNVNNLTSSNRRFFNLGVRYTY